MPLGRWRIPLKFVAGLRNDGGNVSPLFALLLAPLIGAIGLTTEVATWRLLNRAMQNAADSAALAAAANGGETFALEAAAVAARYGFRDGEDNVSVTALEGQPCPGSGDEACYRVTISRDVPINLVRMVGYRGDVDLGATRAKTVSATALASPRGAASGYCLVGLATGGDVIRVDGGASVDLGGCDMRANGELTCNGVNSDRGVNYGDAGPAATSGCGVVRRGGMPLLADPYAGLTPPPNPCHEGNSPKAGPQDNVDATRQLAGSYDWSTPRIICGDVKLSGNVTVTAPNSVLMIGNGRLDLAGHTLRTAGEGSLTLVFGGTTASSGSGFEHYPMSSVSGGALDIAAPTTGPYAGVALFQDPALNGSRNRLDFSYAGNRPAFNVTGLIYLPNARFQIAGAINHHTAGLACIAVVADKIRVSGTGAIFAEPTRDCDRAGLILPPTPGSGQRQTLVE